MARNPAKAKSIKSKSVYAETVYTNPSYAVEAGVVSAADLRKEYTRLRDIEVKRVKRLKDDSVEVPKKLKDIKSDKQFYKELQKLHKRVSGATSSSRAKAARSRAFTKNLEKAGLKGLTAYETKRLESIFRKMESVYKSKYNIYEVANKYIEAREEGMSINAAVKYVQAELIDMDSDE